MVSFFADEQPDILQITVGEGERGPCGAAGDRGCAQQRLWLLE
jgi:hypothetical protein